MPVVPFIPAIISAGASVGGAVLASNAVKGAAKTQAQSADKALEANRQSLVQERADMGPYRNMGYGAVSNLRGLTASPDVADVPLSPYFANDPNQPQPGRNAVPRNTLATVGTAPVAGGAMVSVMAPNGKVGQIPASMLDRAIAAGGRQVSASSPGQTSIATNLPPGMQAAGAMNYGGR